MPAEHHGQLRGHEHREQHDHRADRHQPLERPGDRRPRRQGDVLDLRRVQRDVHAGEGAAGDDRGEDGAEQDGRPGQVGYDGARPTARRRRRRTRTAARTPAPAAPRRPPCAAPAPRSWTVREAVTDRPSHGSPRSAANGTAQPRDQQRRQRASLGQRRDRDGDRPPAGRARRSTPRRGRTTVAISSVQSVAAPRWYGVRSRRSADATTPPTAISTRKRAEPRVTERQRRRRRAGRRPAPP